MSKLGVDNELSIVEIGLGTNNPKLVSTMGKGGKPGASVRAFRDFLPNAEVFGADIDQDILFNEPRLRTAFVNQLDPGSLEAMKKEFGKERFDLIIDDGLHSVEANLNTLKFALRSINKGGWVIIEDIPHRTVNAWILVTNLLSSANYLCGLVKCMRAYIFFLKMN